MAPSKSQIDTSRFERDSGKFAKKILKAKSRHVHHAVRKADQQYQEFVKLAAETDMLLQENAGFLEAEGMEETHKFRQQDIADAVDVGTANKKLDLQLKEFSPYNIDFSRNGRKLLIGGKKGHVASMDWRLGKLDFELFLNETVNAVKYFHNDQYLAVAQKKHTYVYDHQGMELHRLKLHVENTLLDFLPYHMLLVGAGASSILRYQDVSTGVQIAELKTKMGPTQAMKQNRWNAVMHLGHANGTVSLWSPTVKEPLAKLQVTRGPVRDLAIDREGKYMAVGGANRTVQIWDLRKFKSLDTYVVPTPIKSLDFSDTGLLLASWGPHITIWKDVEKTRQEKPYMTHLFPSQRVECSRFVPFEDVLGVGHTGGVSTLIVPGSGEANYDALELNPYESTKQRQEGEVRHLLNKVAPDTIALEPDHIGMVDLRARDVRLNKTDLQQVEAEEKAAADKEHLEIRPDLKPEQSKVKRYLQKNRNNIMDARKMRAERNLRIEEERREKLRRKEMGEPDEKDELGPALGRFA